jgi:hypothetical protein
MTSARGYHKRTCLTIEHYRSTRSTLEKRDRVDGGHYVKPNNLVLRETDNLYDTQRTGDSLPHIRRFGLFVSCKAAPTTVDIATTYVRRSYLRYAINHKYSMLVP